MLKTPKELGYHMPAEWEPHSAVWMSWPYDETTFPNRVGIIEQRYCEMIKALNGSELVQLLILDERHKNRVRKMLADFGVDLAQVTFYIVDYADVWTRDYGALFLVNRQTGETAWVKPEYNALGKGDDPYFEPLLKDNEVFNQLQLPGRRFDMPMVLEGGSIEVNGQEALITTEQCLLNSNRNPHLNKSQIEQNLKDYFGVDKIIWLKRGLLNDHTDGHVDDITRFVAPNKVVTTFTDDLNDENYENLKDNFETLSQTGLEVVKLPLPHMKFDQPPEGGLMAVAPVSYANFYIANKVVLLPQYHDLNDRKAQAIIQSCFPGRKVIPIDCRDLIYGGGAIHCITQQQPGI